MSVNNKKDTLAELNKIFKSKPVKCGVKFIRSIDTDTHTLVKKMGLSTKIYQHVFSVWCLCFDVSV